MEYSLNINGNRMDADVESREEGNFRVVIGEKEYLMDCFPVSENMIHLVVNGKGVNAYLSGKRTGEIVINGRSYRVEDSDSAAAAAKNERNENVSGDVTPPMPAVVVRVPVKEGDTVTGGDPVIVISAMKLETTLTAPFDGRVKSVNVSEKEKVMPGQVLAEIERTGKEKRDG